MRPRVPKEELAHVSLKDLELELQYEQIRADLARYRAEEPAIPQEGELECPGCGAIAPEEKPICPCGVFLHSHLVFTCPGCSSLVERDARDCARCGAAFWSPVNPPEDAITDEMIRDYLERARRELET